MKKFRTKYSFKIMYKKNEKVEKVKCLKNIK